jgi:DNA-binding transcriptional MerR regulator
VETPAVGWEATATTMDYRVEEIAEAAGISVPLVRSYQSKGLLPPPRHDGRVALYDGTHLERLRQIHDLKRRGYSLRAIAQLLEPGRAPQDDDDHGEPVDEQFFNLRELAERTGVPAPLLRSLEATGLIRARRFGREYRYTHSDVKAVAVVLSMVSGGLPMDELIRAARIPRDVIDELSEECVKLFLEYVRGPLRSSGLSQKEQAERLVAAARLTLHGVGSLLAYNVQRVFLNLLHQELSQTGTRSEWAALQREIARRLEIELPA